MSFRNVFLKCHSPIIRCQTENYYIQRHFDDSVAFPSFGRMSFWCLLLCNTILLKVILLYNILQCQSTVIWYSGVWYIQVVNSKNMQLQATRDFSNIGCTIQWLHAPMQCFQNALAYFAAAVSFFCCRSPSDKL